MNVKVTNWQSVAEELGMRLLRILRGSEVCEDYFNLIRKHTVEISCPVEQILKNVMLQSVCRECGQRWDLNVKAYCYICFSTRKELDNAMRASQPEDR